MDVPRQASRFTEVAELVMTALVCEDLAHNDDTAHLIRSVGPTMVTPNRRSRKPGRDDRSRLLLAQNASLAPNKMRNDSVLSQTVNWPESMRP